MIRVRKFGLWLWWNIVLLRRVHTVLLHIKGFRRPYLQRKESVIKTDHKSLCYLDEQQ
jgi:hypothetical protein